MLTSNEHKFKARKKEKVEKPEISKEEIETISKEERVQLKRDRDLKIEDLPFAELTDISASVAGPTYIENNTVVEITRPLSSVKNTGDFSNTVMDPTMSPTTTSKICYTCGYDIETCDGHFGRIVLAAKQYHIGYIGLIISVLYCVCRSCAKLKMSEKNLEKLGLFHYQDLERLKHIANKLKNIKCTDSNCTSTEYDGEIFAKKSIQNGKIFLKKSGAKAEREIDIEVVYQILSKISIEDYRIMGFTITTKGERIIGTHPKDFMIQMLMIRPPRDRRDYFAGGEWTRNPTTKVYDSIVTLNQRLKENLNKLMEQSLTKDKRSKLQNEIDELKTKLFVLIAGLVDSEKFHFKIYGVSQFKGVKQNVTGKGEMVRNNMQSRRVDFVNRTVATADPDLGFGEIGIPEDVAKAQSFPEEVNLLNILPLTKMLRMGMVKTIMPTTGPSKNILIDITDQNRNTINLEVGTIVHREILDGDYIVSNRNPSIHMYSMMGGTAKRRKQMTISPHMAQTTPGQTDFDGDELQVHFPQDVKAITDVKHLMYLSEILMNVQSNRPLMGAVYDVPLGLYLLTRPGGKITKSSFWNVIGFMKSTEQINSLISRAERHHMPITVPQGDYDPEEMYNGRLFVSALFPADFHYSGYGVTIVEGILLDGVIGKPDKNGIIDKNAVGTVHNSIIQVMWVSHGPDRTKNFFTDMYFNINAVYTEIGMTLSFDDMEISDPRVLVEIEKKQDELIEKYESLQIPSDLDRLARDKYERDASQITQDITNFSSEKIKNIPGNLNEIAKSKTKGGPKNLVAIMDRVGQQTLAGERLVPQLMDGKVCFNFFSPEDKSLESRGFCDRSYAQGLTLEQYTMHGAASREQLVNVSVSTRFVGYDHRSLVKKSEDLITAEDGSVRDKGVLIQQAFGGHSLNPTQLQVLNSKYGKIPQPLDLDTIVGKINSLFHTE